MPQCPWHLKDSRSKHKSDRTAALDKPNARVAKCENVPDRKSVV